RRPVRSWLNPVYRTQHHQLRIALLHVLALEKIPKDGDVAQSRHLAGDIGDAVVHEPGNDETLPILKFKFGLRLAGTQRRNGETGNGKCIREIQLADFRHHLKMDVVVRHDEGSEFQLHSKLSELNCHRSEALPRLNDGERKLAAREKTCFLAVDRDQVWLGENLQQVFLLQGLYDGTNRNVGARN